MKTFVTGNSHIGALAAGFRTIAPDRSDVRVFALGNGKYESTPFSTRSGTVITMLVPAYREKLLRCTGSEAIDTSARWGFCSVNHNSRIYRDPRWQVNEPASIATRRRGRVSDAQLQAILERDHDGVRRLFEQLLDLGVAFFAISAPPPRQDLKAFERGTRREVVGYINNVARELWRNWTQSRGICLIEPPPSSLTADGFLETRYQAPDLPDGRRDPHHANPEYGVLMMQRILAHLAEIDRPAE